ncbi:MAG TPA: hypothetical protein DCS82_08315 [Rhodospirillaceae bacterium]|nr:hypothetical protein [Rhodospirillaceae bacterium]HAA93245.1 hypothetical protein [Rhodospirillaceae bacterium]HAT35706.1 hypothetical protein [Rhodospirillaceae bacterium]|tara:strand:- start:1508 stop:2299 length:792 start_codon:yes stop_codon:yes gene_type:complete
MDLGLNGRKALVSGANRGIGRACAIALAEEGCDVALFARDEESCQEVTDMLKEQHPDGTFVTAIADLGMNPTVKKAVDDAAEALGGIDIVVNAAGGSARGGLGVVPHEEWHRRLDAKPLGLIAVCEAALPYLEESDQARLINLSGLHGKEPVPWAAMAGIVNAAVHGFSKCLATELGPKGIRVNVVTPGFTSGRRFDELIEITAREKGMSETDAEKWLRELVPLGGPADPEDVAAGVVFLASAQANMITGTELKIDGGRSRHI